MSSDHVFRNRNAWNIDADGYVEPGRACWESAEVTWGIWSIPEVALQLLPDVQGLATLELGCGTAYVSAWLARRGARPLGLDVSENQLATARRLQSEFSLTFPLVRANAEETPFADASFDLCISEYGASIWCDPYAWIPEAARVLKPGGRLIFLVNGALLMLCAQDDEAEPATETLLRSYFGMHRFEFPDTTAVEFHVGHGDWIRLLRANGFDVEDLVELRPAGDATTRHPFVTAKWASQWPSEEVWKATKKPEVRQLP